MLELEKLELEKPKRIDMFKKAISGSDERSKQIKSLDFFKTSSKKKNPILFKIHNFLLIAFFLNIGIGSFVDYFQSKAILAQADNNVKLYQQISDELRQKNTVNISLYRLLKDSPLSSADLLSSVIVTQVLSDDKISSKNRTEVLKIYVDNWKSGLEKQNEYFNNCQLSIVCHIKNLALKDNSKKIEEMLQKTAFYASYPDIYKAQMELNKLKMEHNTYFKD
jgi:uncharacterized Ntn-hydrolase superfamily protein